MTEPGQSTRQTAVAEWFEALQRRIVAAFEALEDEASDRGEAAAGRFEMKPWSRQDHSGAPGGGGRMGMLRGQLFEKAGIHSSTVFGTFAPEFAAQIKGADKDPRFWAAGLSLIAHPWSPEIPTVHMNTRFVVTTRQWFGGGADLTPMLDRRRSQDDADARLFHQTMAALCARHAGVASIERFKAWCDDYFFLKHRGEPRGIGGIFYDDLICADDPAFDATFAFTRDLGETFLDLYPAIVRANLKKPWRDQDREEQLVRRGRYVEFNLLYDRGTLFGLKTGGNIESILSSMPPTVRWP
jgi:coproporphyrinogen III oxidase